MQRIKKKYHIKKKETKMEQKKIKFIFKDIDPMIYPRRIFLCIGGDRQNIANLFYDKDGDPFYVEPYIIESSYALTFSNAMTNKKTGLLGVLLWFHDVEHITDSIIAHEAVHTANTLFSQIGINLSTENDEPQAFFVGFIVDKINEVLKEMQ